MCLVPAGEETGIYYIILSNIYFKSTWQNLKDFARNRQSDGTYTNVEHACIYPGSGDGWVSVRGKADFRKTFKHLNGGIFHGRALIADDRNETQAINLRDFGPKYQGSESSSRPDAYATGYYQNTISTLPNSPGSREVLSDWTYPQQSPKSTTYSATFSPVSPTPQLYDNKLQFFPSISQPPPPIYYAGNISTPVFVIPAPYPVPVNYAISPPISHHPTSPATIIPPPNNYNGLVKTEARKVVITHINTANSELEVRDLIIWAFDSNSRSRRIEEFEYPRHPDGKPRGHALVVLDSYETAKRVVRALEGLKWGDQTLGAKFAKEGAVFHSENSRGDQGLAGMMERVSVSGSDNSSSRKEREKSSRTREREGEKKSEKGKEKERRKTSRPREVKSENRSGEALIVDGTSGKRRK